MKKLILTSSLVMMTSGSSFAKSVILHCLTNETPQNKIQNELTVFQENQTYSYIYTEHAMDSHKTLIRQSRGLIEPTLYNGHPTMNFKNDTTSIFQLCGRMKVFLDSSLNIDTQFHDSACKEKEVQP